MTRKYVLICIFFIAILQRVKAQSNESKWTFGLHLAAALYQDVNGQKIGGSIISQIPRGSIAMYFKNGFTLEGALGISTIDSQKYTTFDGAIRYDFGNSEEKVVPYVFLGGSIVSASNPTPTLNFGAGNTFWILPNYGLNIQLMYKFSETQFESQFSHVYPSVGLIYSLKPRNMNPRLWDMKH